MPKLNRAESLQLLQDLELKAITDLTEDWLASFLGKLNDPVKLKAWNTLLDILKEFDPPNYKKLNQYASQNKGMLLEYRGWEPWLTTLGALTFTRPFAPIQRKFWEWNWNCLMKVRRGIPLTPKERHGFLPWPRGTGKCVAAGTEVLKVDGTRVPIETIVEGDVLVSIDRATGRSVPDTVKEIWFTGKKRCLRVRTRTNKVLELTPEHRLWTFAGWREAGRIAKGDRIALPRRTFTRPSASRSDEEVRLLAYMIAEGCTTKVSRRYDCITSHSLFTNADKTIVDDFKHCAAFMGFAVRSSGRYGYRLSDAKQHSRGPSSCQTWIRDTGLAHKGAHEKRVPSWVFQLSEHQRWVFLAAMIDTDGWTSKSEGIAIALTSEGLIDDLTYLFLSVGVVSTKRAKINRKPDRYHQAFTLAVDKEYVSKCAANMPLRLKGQRLLDAAAYAQRSLLDVYPSSVGKGLPKGVNRKIRGMGGPQLNSTSPTLTRPKIRAALACCLIPHLMWLEQADVFWDEVVSIEHVGAKEVYDIEMSSTSHNFIANGIVSHNSSTVEWACIAEGAFLKTGYVIILSSKQTQAEEHVVAIRDRIEKEHVADLYPWMGKPKIGTHGNKFGWSRDFLLTAGGWAIRPVGADVAIRGGKTLDLRPSLIVPEDYDEVGDSPLIVEHKMHILTRTILPMGNEKTRVLVPQNPIHVNSCVNQMLTGATLALAVKTVFGEIEEDGTMSARPVPAVKGLAYEVRQSDEGPYAEITEGESNWPGISTKAWEEILNTVSPEAFEAEYQHAMDVAKEERVLPEYDDRLLRLHVITWSQFEQKYQMRRIPSDWSADCGLDIGYSGSHKSAWTFLAKVPDIYELSGSIFRYRGRSFTGMNIEDQAVAIRNDLWPDERLERQFMSHEKLGERLTLNGKHDWHFNPCDSAKTAGIAQWRHFLRTDRTQPHPFHRDEKLEDGRWKLGRPAWFDIVADKQFFDPVDDNGLKRHRDSAFNWRNVPIKLTDKGLTIEQPAKINDDEVDATRMLTVAFGPLEQRPTQTQKLNALIPAGYHRPELAQRTDMDSTQKQMTGDMAAYLAKRTIKLKQPPLVDAYGQPLR